MIRLVFIVLALVAAVYLALQIFKEARSAGIDWRSVGFAAGFVALAVYLRHTTEIGGIG